MVDHLEALGIDVLFVIGGDGTLAGPRPSSSPRSSGASCRSRWSAIPKTIDNDIHFIDRSFGFESAFAAAVEAIRSAHVEATGARNGIGLVKLMGRHSGFIACHAALASTDVELRADPRGAAALDGRARLPARCSSARLEQRAHAVIVVAEGAGQELCARPRRRRRAHRRQRQRAPEGHRPCAARPHHRSTSRSAASTITLKYIDPELPDPQRPRLAVGQRLLLEHGPQRGPRGDGRQHRDARSAAGTGGSCTCRCRWRRASASRSTPRKTCGCR